MVDVGTYFCLGSRSAHLVRLSRDRSPRAPADRLSAHGLGLTDDAEKVVQSRLPVRVQELDGRALQLRDLLGTSLMLGDLHWNSMRMLSVYHARIPGTQRRRAGSAPESRIGKVGHAWHPEASNRLWLHARQRNREETESDGGETVSSLPDARQVPFPPGLTWDKPVPSSLWRVRIRSVAVEACSMAEAGMTGRSLAPGSWRIDALSNQVARLLRRRKSSNSGTVKSTSPWPGL